MAAVVVAGCTVTLGCRDTSMPPVTWAVTCTTYCSGDQSSATGTLCWDRGDSPEAAAQESVGACEAMLPCSTGALRCSCTATEIGQSCQTPGDMLSLTNDDYNSWTDPCLGTCMSDEVCIDDGAIAACYPISDCTTPYAMCSYSDGTYGCVDLDNDPYNCGGCGSYCAGVCSFGVCQ
jgi:hypothetical protein